MESVIEFYPLTSKRWPDLVELFQGHGNPGYCWCTFWRLSSQEYGEKESAERNVTLKNYVHSGIPTGIIGYLSGEPIGWCSIAPREIYARLELSRTIPMIDQRVIWSIVCFYLDRRYRKQYLTVKFPEAAIEYTRSQGAEVIEGYPVEPEMDVDGN